MSLLGCVILLSIPIVRRPFYEFFLRTHQTLSALLVYALWRHVPSDQSFPRYWLYILLGLYVFLCVVQGCIVVYQNGFLRSGHAQADITREYGAVRLQIRCRRPLKVKAGQHINLWLPSISFWSFLQSHPFVVISWAEKPQNHLDLFIEPRGGWTHELLRHVLNGSATHSPVLFSGPHGKTVCMVGHEIILMIAKDFGIAAQLPYLKRLIHGYNTRQLRARRVHLVWQVRDISKSLKHISFITTKNLTRPDVAIAAQTLLNGALDEDTLDDGWVRQKIPAYLWFLTADYRSSLSRSIANRTTFPANHSGGALMFIQVRPPCKTFLTTKLQKIGRRRSRSNK